MLDLDKFQYEKELRVQYEGGATFVRHCITCGRYVKPDRTIKENDEAGLHPGPNATCKKCGRTRMIFEGFI